MARKKDRQFPLPDDVGHDFEDEHDILNFQPRIEFVEPEQQPGDIADFEDEEEETIDDFRARTEDLIKNYDAIKKLAEQAQRRIDQRVAAGGGVTVQLDPAVDGHVIAAIKRQFPDKTDPTVIDYDCYKQCLKGISKQQPDLPLVTDADIADAKSDPLRTNFGGYGNQHGQNRPEISSPAASVKPLDLSAFQAAGVLAIFLLMLPMIKLEDKLEIAQHLVSAGHAV